MKLTFATLWANSADVTLMIFSLLFVENKLGNFLQIVSKLDNLH